MERSISAIHLDGFGEDVVPSGADQKVEAPEKASGPADRPCHEQSAIWLCRDLRQFKFSQIRNDDGFGRDGLDPRCTAHNGGDTKGK